MTAWALHVCERTCVVSPVVICSELPVFFASLPVFLAGGGSVSVPCDSRHHL